MFAELLARSCFSFLRGASHPEELVSRAQELGLAALGLCDRDGLYGSARAFLRAREVEQRVIVGAELSLEVGAPKRRRTKPRVDPPTVALLVRDHDGYASLCRLLTLSHADRPKGESALSLADLAEHNAGLVAVVPASRVPGESEPPAALFELLPDVFADRAFVATHRHLDGFDRERTRDAEALSARYALPVVASSRPLYHHASRKALADVLHCIRTGTTLDRAGSELGANAEAHLRSASQMQRLFPDHPGWVERTVEIASELRFSLGELRYRFPCALEPGESADEKLRRLTLEGAPRRYPGGTPPAVAAQIDKELALIEKLGVAPYFLSTWEVVEMARRRRILCQGRGSAANSAVCYVLGITAVDPARSNLLFERFMSAERSEPPDIDIDFEHERREEVIQEIYERYGRDRAAMVSEVISYRGKSALREVGKAFGLSLDQVDRLSSTITHWHSDEASSRRLGEMGFDVDDARLRQAVMLARALEGFPRHLSIHVGGFVLSADPLCEVAPVEPARMEGRTVVPWDKDDLDALGFFKIDVLGLGMLTAIRKCLALLHADGLLPPTQQVSGNHRKIGRAEDEAGHCRYLEARPARPAPCQDGSGHGAWGLGSSAARQGPANPESARHSATAPPPRPVPAADGLFATSTNAGPPSGAEHPGQFDPLDVITRIPPEDPRVYDMICRADTVGVFQIESRAQMSMLPRLGPRCFYDLVVEVAIVRPGPIQGGMVHPYLKRRNREEPIQSPHPDLWPILERTLGVPLFQEQVMQIAIVGAGYSGGEADQLRRDMAAWKKTGRLMRHRQRLLDGFAKRGISAEFGAALFEQIKGFGEYGFPESHAASFALLVYSSAWQKAHYPAYFACALLNSQPMGFYSPSSIVQDAQRHGVTVRDVSVAHSFYDSTLEDGEASRVGDQSAEDRPSRDEQPGPSRALRLGFRVVKGLGESAARRIEAARAERGFSGLDDLLRRARLKKNEVEALAEAGALEPLVRGRRQALWKVRAPRTGGLFDKLEVCEPEVTLPGLRPVEQLLLDYGRKGLSVADHPMRYLRPRLSRQHVLTSSELMQAPKGARVAVAGLVTCRQQPGTASGVVFITLEDETGSANLIVYRDVFEQFHLVARHAVVLLARGEVERQGQDGEAAVVHLIVRDLARLDVPGRDLPSMSRDFH